MLRCALLVGASPKPQADKIYCPISAVALRSPIDRATTALRSVR